MGKCKKLKFEHHLPVEKQIIQSPENLGRLQTKHFTADLQAAHLCEIGDFKDKQRETFHPLSRTERNTRKTSRLLTLCETWEDLKNTIHPSENLDRIRGRPSGSSHAHWRRVQSTIESSRFIFICIFFILFSIFIYTSYCELVT